jgi:hypothetical protein
MVLRPVPAAPFVDFRRYLIVVPRPLPEAALVMLRRALFIYRGARCPRRRSLCVEGTLSLRSAVARGATQVVERGAQAASRGGAGCASRVLDCGAIS